MDNTTSSASWFEQPTAPARVVRDEVVAACRQQRRITAVTIAGVDRRRRRQGDRCRAASRLATGTT
jgi:hypothetical protein